MLFVIVRFESNKLIWILCLFDSNGKLDPWSGGGVQQSLSKTLVAIMIEDAAHHLDLRSSNPADPQSVIKARALEKQIVKNWIKNSRNDIEKNRKSNSVSEKCI